MLATMSTNSRPVKDERVEATVVPVQDAETSQDREVFAQRKQVKILT